MFRFFEEVENNVEVILDLKFSFDSFVFLFSLTLG